MVANSIPAPATLAELRRGPHVSYSQIKMYLMCPARFYHAYTVKTEPSHRPLALVLGSAVHTALGMFYGHVQGTGTKIPEANLLDVFRAKIDAELDAPIPIRMDDDSDGTDMIDQGVALLRTFYAQADCPRVLAVEQPFAVALFDPATGEVFDAPLIGAADLIVQGVNRPLVIEHKTSSKRYAQWQLEFEVQPACYAYACRQIGLGEVDVQYQILVKSKSPSVQQCPIQRTDRQINEMLSTFSAVVRAVDQGIFYKNRSWGCSDCQFRWKCDED